MNYSHLPYRQGVQVYVIKDDELLLVTGVNNPHFYKPPSGGMDPGETPYETCLREMKEELGVEVTVLKQCEFKNKYRWPKQVVELFNNAYKGQDQYVFIVTIEDKAELFFEEKEIMYHKWVPLNSLDDHLILDNQREMAKRVLEEYYKL